MKFDIILRNGRVIDTESRSIENNDVGIACRKIAYVGSLANCFATVEIDCTNKIVAPSFIDAHVHIESSMVQPSEFSRAVICHGTTAVIADPHEIVNVGGAAALDAFLDMCEQSVIDIFTVVPSSVPATPFDTNGAGEFLAQDMQKYVDRDDIVGLGEVMCFQDVLRGDKKILDKIKLFKKKTIDGHTAGLDSKSLGEYAIHGVQNDHECQTFEEANLRIDCGMNVYIREGSAARNLDAIVSGLLKHNKDAITFELQEGNKVAIDCDLQEGKKDAIKFELQEGKKDAIKFELQEDKKDADVSAWIEKNEKGICDKSAKAKTIDIGKFAFCTDDKHLNTIEKDGHINYNVRRAIELGMSLVDAVTLASHNPAKFYRLTDRGNLTVGMRADIVILSDEKASMVDTVIKDGKIVAKSQKMVFIDTKSNIEIPFTHKQTKNNQPCIHNSIELSAGIDNSHQSCIKNIVPLLHNTIKYKKFDEKDFEIEKRSSYTAIELQPWQLVTNKIVLTQSQTKHANTLATIERYGKTGNISRCFVVGYGLQNGAIATSVSHDSHNTVVCGDNNPDMAVAVNRLREIGGGYVIVSNGAILGELPLEIGGLMSENTAQVVQKTLHELDKIARDMGVCDGIDPFTTLSFVALPVIPHLRLLESGLFDVDNSCLVK